MTTRNITTAGGHDLRSAQVSHKSTEDVILYLAKFQQNSRLLPCAADGNTQHRSQNAAQQCLAER